MSGTRFRICGSSGCQYGVAPCLQVFHLLRKLNLLFLEVQIQLTSGILGCFTILAVKFTCGTFVECVAQKSKGGSLR